MVEVMSPFLWRCVSFAEMHYPRNCDSGEPMQTFSHSAIHSPMKPYLQQDTEIQFSLHVSAICWRLASCQSLRDTVNRWDVTTPETTICNCTIWRCDLPSGGMLGTSHRQTPLLFSAVFIIGVCWVGGKVSSKHPPISVAGSITTRIIATARRAWLMGNNPFTVNFMQ